MKKDKLIKLKQTDLKSVFVHLEAPAYLYFY